MGWTSCHAHSALLPDKMLRPITLAAIALLFTYLFSRLRHKRFKQHAKLPQLPSSLLLGHLKTLDELTKRGAADRHPGT